MSNVADDDRTLLAGIRQRNPAAWEQLIRRYEGRLLAYATSRLGDVSSAEDVVQESFVGLLLALPNYDAAQTPLEPFLFSIAAHKLTDALRRRGVRPRLLEDDGDLPGRMRGASTLLRSQERAGQRTTIIRTVMQELIRQWFSRGEYERLKCIELLFVAGETNQAVAHRLGLTEQAVANHKAFVMQKLREAARLAGLNEADTLSD